MNKHHHRIVFNKARGILMAVAETAASHSGGHGQSQGISASEGRPGTSHLCPRVTKLQAHMMLAWGAVIMLFSAPTQAQIVVDPRAPGNQQPTVTTTGSNNVPLVNIQTPSAAGVSRNTYSQFDVQRNGVILNNARTNAQTQLGGWVQGNPWLAAGSARVILNEVTSGNPSQLAGFMEVAGQRAQVIVANPAGISCDGCGFINANRGTLTTGTPLITNGNLDGYRVTGGLIEITGAGLQGQSTDYTDLISRAVKVNAGIWAQQLQVTTGVNQVSSDQTTVTPLATGQATDSAPAFALDTSQLGGMYAGKIVLVGTEAGLGMRNAGQISATSGSLTLTHEGQLINTGSLQASAALSVRSTSTIDNQGQIAGQSTAVQSATLNNTGLIDGQDTLITATALNNLGSGRIYGDNLAISAATLTQTAQTSGNQMLSPVIAARQRLDIGATNLQNNEQALIFSAGDLFVGGALDGNRHATLDAPGRAATLNNVGGRIEALGALTLNAGTVNNSNAGFTTQVVETSRSTQQEYQLSGSPNRWQPAQITYVVGRNNDREVDSINTPEGGSEDFNRYDYTRVITQTQVTSSKPGNIVAGGNMVLTGGTLNNTDSRILAGGTLTATVAQVNNVATPGTSTTSDGDVTATHLYRIQHKGRDEQGEDSTVYTPPAVIQNITVSPQVMQAHTAPSSVSGASSQTSVPGNGLLITTPLSSAAPLIEVDPRFANQRQWLSSDYMLAQLSIDPATVQKRLGDGFYEQSLVRDQVAQLTGRRFLDGYGADEAQYRALIDNGVTVARALNLRPGVALSAAQAAQLTSDIVVLETTTVTLANGQTAQVLKPQVYLKPRAGDLQANGNLMAAQNLNLQVSGDVVTSGGMGARQVLSVSANNIRNAGGSLNGQSANLQATQDIVVEGGQISAVDQISLQAGRDIALSTTTASNGNTQGSRTYTDRVASLYVSGAAGQLLVNAARDASLQGAQVANEGAGGQTTLAAGRNLTLGTVQTSERNDIVWNEQNQRHDSTSQEVGSTVQTQGNIALQAGQDLGVRASGVQSQSGALTATASSQVRIEAGQTQQTVNEAHQSRSKGLLSSKTTTKRDTADNTLNQGSTLSATSVGVNAGQSIAVQGSSVVSDNGTTLNAQGNVSLEAAQGRLSSTHSVDTKQSGLLGGGGGIGITVGTRQQSNAQAESSTTSLASTVGSTAGSVHASAGQQYSQVGSDVLTPAGNVNITAKKVDIVAAQNTSSDTTQTRYKQTGVTVALTNPIISAVQTAQQMKKVGSQTQDSRMKALSKLTTVLAANNAAGDVAKDPNNAGGVNLSLSLGHSQSASQQVQSSTTSSGSRIQAGGDIDIQATGAASASDLTVKGSDLKAGNNVNLQADHAVNLLAEQNTAQQHSTNHNTSASVGVSIGTDGLLLNVGASGGRGKANGSDSTWANTHVEAGQNLNLTSGGDTTLKGAVAKGQQVTAHVGGKLNVQSLQDTSTFDSKQQSLGGSVSVGYGKTGGSISASQTTVNSDYASVTEQTGIQAGDAGFTITVNGATVLTGAVIASTDKAVQDGKNSLTTASLSTADIQNKADYEAKAISVSAGSKAGQSSAGFGSDSGHASSTTTAGVSGIAGNKAVRTGDAQQGIGKIFDQAQVTQEVGAQVAITSAFGQQAAKAVGDFGQSKTKPVDDARERQALDKLAETGSLSAAQQTRLDTLSRQGMSSAQASANLADASLLKDYDNWKEGGAYRVAAHTAVGALAGGAGGALGSGTTAAAMPTVADAINDLKLPEPVRQAVIAATGTAIGATVGGTAGAVSGLNQTTNNFLVHQQVDALKKDLAKCQSKSNGCSDADVSAIVNTYRNLSNQNIAKVQSCISQGDTACVQKLESQAAAAGELSGVLPLGFGSQERQLQDRQTNVTLYGSVKGNASLFGTDLDQARQVSQFRQDNCGGVSTSTCDGLVQQALTDRMKRVGVLMAVGTLTPLAVRELNTLRIPTAMGGASKLSANEFTMEPGKASAPVKVDGTFETVGLKRDPLTFPDGVKMVQSLQKTGLTQQEAIDVAESYIRSGATPPVATPLDVTDKLVKVVPAGGQPSATTGYWMRESELTKLQQDPPAMANKLGLPPGMQVDKFDVYQIVPRQGSVTYESTIAPTKVDGVANTTGGAKQTIVLDRTQFTPPVKTGSIVVTKGH